MATDYMTGSMFKQMRESLGESQASLAELFEISPMTVYKQERSPLVAEKYARAITALSRREPFKEDLRRSGTGRGRPRGSAAFQTYDDVDIDALAEYNKLVAAGAALYRLCKSRSAKPLLPPARAVTVPAPIAAALSPAEKLIIERKEWDDFFDANPLMSRIYPDHLK